MELIPQPPLPGRAAWSIERRDLLRLSVAIQGAVDRLTMGIPIPPSTFWPPVGASLYGLRRHRVTSIHRIRTRGSFFVEPMMFLVFGRHGAAGVLRLILSRRAALDMGSAFTSPSVLLFRARIGAQWRQKPQQEDAGDGSQRQFRPAPTGRPTHRRIGERVNGIRLHRNASASWTVPQSVHRAVLPSTAPGACMSRQRPWLPITVR